MRPIVSDYYHDPKNHLELLREEPTLACTIIATAARYTRLPGHGALTRGHLLHNSLLRHVQACTQRIIWGFGEEEMGIGRTIGFIESLLIFVCWVRCYPKKGIPLKLTLPSAPQGSANAGRVQRASTADRL